SMTSFTEFIQWYEAQTAQTLPNTEHPDRKIRPVYAVSILIYAGKITGKARDIVFHTGAYEYAKRHPSIQDAPVCVDFDDFIEWYERQTPETLPNDYNTVAKEPRK